MPSNVIPTEHVEGVCKPFTGSCCRYLALGPDGKGSGQWECMKLKTGYKKLVDARVLLGDMNATGDNCEGIGEPEECPVPRSLQDLIEGGIGAE